MSINSSPMWSIDDSRPMSFCGFRTEASDDPVLVRLAKESGLPQLTNLASPVTDEISLAIEETHLILNYIRSSAWLPIFEEDLQSIGMTNDGEPLLSGSVPWSTFEQFVSTASDVQDRRLSDLLLKLSEATKSWPEEGVQDVCFDGFEVSG